MRPAITHLKNGTSLIVLGRNVTVLQRPQPAMTVRLFKDGKFVTPPVKVRPPWRKP